MLTLEIDSLPSFSDYEAMNQTMKLLKIVYTWQAMHYLQQTANKI